MECDFFKNRFLRKTLASWCAFATLATMCGSAWAVSGALDSGSAVLTQTSGNVGGSIGGTTGTFTLTSGSAGVLDWSKLSLNSGETLNYNGAGSFYNVVNSAGGMSTIAGAINGADAANVYIFNPNGILFNSGSSVNVGGVFGALATGVSGSALTDWMANPGAVPAAIKDATMTGDITVNGGTFTASQLAFAGKNVAIKGGTFKGSTALAAGDKVTIDGFGGGAITLTVPDTATEGDVDVLGEFVQNLEIKAAGDTTVAKGSLKVGEKLTVKSTNGDGVFRGGFVANNAKIAAKSADVDVAGDVWVQGKTDFTTTAGDVALKSRAGQVNVLGTAGDDKATIQATGGNLTIDSAVGIEIGKNGVVLATKKADNTLGDVTLTTAGKDSLSGDGIQIAGAGAKVSADNGVTLKAVDGNVTIKDGAEVAAASEAKTLTIEAAKGAISGDATSKLTGKGATSLKAAVTKNITLEGVENDLKGAVDIVSAKDVKIVNNGNLTIGNATADSLDLRVTDADAMSVKATGDITAQKLVAQKSDGTANVVFEQSAGTVTVTGGEGIDSVLTAKTVKQTGAGTINADKIAGDVEQTGAAKLQANDTTKGLTITGTLKQNDANAQVGTGSEVVTVGGLLTQDGGTLNANALVLKGGAGQGEQGKIAATTVDLQGESNDFTLLGGANAIGKIGTSLPGGVQTVRVKNASALEIGTAKASGNFLAETENGSITVDGSKVAAGKALIVTAGGGVDLRKAAEVSGENIRLEAKGAGGDATVAKGVTVSAAKNLTVVAEHDVNANGLLEAKDGSVYAKAGNDVNLGEGQVIRARGTDGNVLLEAGRDIAGVGGQEAVVSAEGKGSSDGYVSLVAGRDAGANVRIDGKKVTTWIKGDATLNLHGDVEVTLEADGNVTVNHTDGTLSVVKGGASGVDAKVNEVVDAETLAVHKLSDKAGSGEGLVGKNVTVSGTDGSSLDVVSVLRASETADVSVDGDAVVHGRLEAGKDATVVAGRDVSVESGARVHAGNWLTLTAAKGDVRVTGVGTQVAAGGDGAVKNGHVKIDAKRDVEISDGAQVSVGGRDWSVAPGLVVADLDAGRDVILDKATLVANNGITINAPKAVTVRNSSQVTSTGGQITIGGGDTVSETLTVDGSQVTAERSALGKAKAVTVENGAKVESDQFVNLIATEGDLLVDKSDVTVGDLIPVGLRAGQVDLTAEKGDLTIKDSTVSAAQIVYATASGDLAVQNGATVTGGKDVLLTAGNDLTVVGDGTTLMAGKAAALSAGNDLMIREDAVVIARGKNLEAGEKALTVKALDGSITIDDTTGVRETLVAAKGGIEMVAKKDVVIKGGDDKGGVVIESYDTLAARARTGKIEVRNAFVSGVKDLALTADKGDVTAGGLASLSAGQDVKVTASEGAVTMADAVQVEAGRDVVVTAAKDVSVQDGANVFASRHLTADATEGGLTVGGSAKVRALSNVRLAAAGDTMVNSKVTAGEHLTVIGRNVAQNADFTAEDGSVYVEATGGDIAMAAGTRTVAGKKVAGSTDGQGNILYTATGDVGASGGGATLAADPTFNDGAIVLDAGGTAGRNMTLEAARVGVDAKGDVNLELVGDVNFGARSLEGSVAIVHRDGTLTVDKTAVLPSDKVVKVIDVNTTEDILLAPRLPSDLNGIEAKTAATIVGQPNSTVVVKDGSGVYAKGGDATVTVDKDIRVDGKVESSADALLTAGNDVTVNGTVQAGENLRVTAGGNLATPGRGKLVAGRDLFVDVRSSTPQINVAVGKGISARSGQRAIAFRTVGGYAYPEVYGNNSETAVFIDGRVAGGNAADFAFLQGCEQAAAFGNAYLAPVFTRMADIFPLTVDTDMRAPGASLTQGYLTSEKGSIAEEGDESEEPEEPAEASTGAPVQTAGL